MEGLFQIDRIQVAERFDEYVSNYDDKDEMIKLKIDHTYRVAGLCDRIAKHNGMTEQEADFAWLSGMLHDIGRFEQAKRYGTFIDAKSVDHAEFGADLLFSEKLIQKFVKKMDDSVEMMLEQVIRQHNKFAVKESLDDLTMEFCHVLRDADKIDIIKVSAELSPEAVYGFGIEAFSDCVVSEYMFDCFCKHEMPIKERRETPLDFVVSHISFLYGLVYPVSFQIVVEQGYLGKMFAKEHMTPEAKEQFAVMKQEMMDYIGRRIQE